MSMRNIRGALFLNNTDLSAAFHIGFLDLGNIGEAFFAQFAQRRSAMLTDPASLFMTKRIMRKRNQYMMVPRSTISAKAIVGEKSSSRLMFKNPLMVTSKKGRVPN